MEDPAQSGGTSLYQHQVIRQVSDRGSRGNTPPQVLSPDVPTLTSQFRLICPQCLQDIKRPKQLETCFHIFCAECLKEILGDTSTCNETIKCPTCDKTSSCPNEVDAWLDSDTYLHAFQGYVSVYAESGNVKCSDSVHTSPVAAAVFCLQCGKNFCEECRSNHDGNESFKNHNCLCLFQSPAMMTVATGRREMLFAPRDELDAEGADRYQCPVCRNTAMCEHLKAVTDLLQEDVRKVDHCPIPSHVDTGNSKLIAYCEVCEEPVCINCSSIVHRDHKTINIEDAREKKLYKLKTLKVALDEREIIFKDAVHSAEGAQVDFQNHMTDIQREMIARKGKVQTEVEHAFNAAYSIIEQTGQKVAELSRQLSEMNAEKQFLQATLHLAELASKEGTTGVEVVRIWKGLDFIHESMGGVSEKKNAKVMDAVLPQEIKEKRLVLPATNCMTPNLGILEKIGVEGKVMELSFILKAEEELLMFYSILPLTDTLALVACQTEACKSVVVGYDNLRGGKPYSSVILEEEGQYCLVDVPGNGVVATHYQSKGACSSQTKKQVLFWDHALDWSMEELEKRGGRELKPFAQTPLPPRGIAVTRENHLVICMADDPAGGSGDLRRRQSDVLLMTLKGDVLRQMPSVVTGRTTGGRYFPRFVTVNINGDICVTDAEDRSVRILNGQLREKLQVRNPYTSDDKNKNFTPMGICHDSFGRLIVADPTNHTVIRFENDGKDARPILEHGHGSAKDMWDPTLVALGPGPKLWVVCRTNILVFNYMDKE